MQTTYPPGYPYAIDNQGSSHAKARPRPGADPVESLVAEPSRCLIQQGQYAGLKADLILGSDGCGTVTEAGAGVDTGWVGKEVVINPGQNWGPDPRASGRDFKILGNPDPGTFAEYVVTDARYIYNKPAYLSPAEAAALPLGGLTTYRAVITKAQVKPGEKVLITGIGAGTALIAFRLAQAAGAEVYVTSGSPEKLDKAIAARGKRWIQLPGSYLVQPRKERYRRRLRCNNRQRLR